MNSPQDLLMQRNGGFGGIRISDSIGNTGWASGSLGPNVITGNFGMVEVLSDSTFSDGTVSSLQNITGYSFPAGATLWGRHTKIQLSGGDIIAYYRGARDIV